MLDSSLYQKKRQKLSTNCHILLLLLSTMAEQSRTQLVLRVDVSFCTSLILKEGAAIKNLLVSPKDKDSITKKSSVMFWFRCDKTDCEEEYIGESSITFGERYKERWKAPSPIYEHQNNTSHTTSVENF